MISRRALLELEVDSAEVHAGDTLAGWVRLRNPSSREKTYHTLELRLDHGKLHRAGYRSRSTWALREELAIAPVSEVEVRFGIPVPEYLASGTGELSAMCEPFGFSLVGPPVVLVYVLPHREYVAMVHALEAIGNCRLPTWSPEPRSSGGTEFVQVEDASQPFFVSRLKVRSIEYGKEAVGTLTVTWMDTDRDGNPFESGVERIQFRVSLREAQALEQQFREILAPIWNGTVGLPLPATYGVQDQDLPIATTGPTLAQ